MDLKQGDKVYCYKDVIWETVDYNIAIKYTLFKVGEWYNIVGGNKMFVEVDTGSYHGIVNFGLLEKSVCIDFDLNTLRQFTDYFADKKQLRKLKLDGLKTG